jgi:predicted nucleic acid-binding protein
MILIDTDICIELLNGNKQILRKREQYESMIGISFMSVAELYYGAEKSSESYCQ